MKKINLKAFSLVELSFSLVIIGVMIAGIVGGSVLIKKSKLATAQSLTNSSPVASTPDLKLWAETSLSSAVKLNSSNTISTQWSDINPQSKIKQNLTSASATTVFATGYSEETINDLPALNFNSGNYFLIPNSKVLTNSSYTIFLVEKPSALSGVSGDTLVYFTNGAATDSAGAAATPLKLLYNYTAASSRYTTLKHSNSTLSFSYNYQVGSVNIHTIKYNKTSNTSYYWLNGGLAADASGSGGNLTNCYETYFGGGSYRGYISEFILFTRSLTDEERQDIETYLSKKYAIKLS